MNVNVSFVLLLVGFYFSTLFIFKKTQYKKKKGNTHSGKMSNLKPYDTLINNRTWYKQGSP